MAGQLGPVRAGAAAVDVTPRPRCHLAGLSAGRLATGTHDPLWARALALGVGPLTVGLVTVDCLGLAAPQVEQIRCALGRGYDSLIVCASHTHAGPDTLGLWGRDERDERALARLLSGCRQAASEALAALRPARLKLAHAPLPGHCAVNLRAPQSLDSDVHALTLTEPGGATIATLVNWACHPETLRDDNLLYSADFVHALRGTLEASLGGLALFANGALGGLVTVDCAENSFAEADRIGTAVADTATAALAEQLDSTDWVSLVTAHEELLLPLVNDEFARAAAAGVLRRGLVDGQVATRLSAWSLGNATFVSCPGELQPALGRRWRRMMQRPYRFLLGLADDELGYILGREDHQRELYAYERSMSLGPETAGRLTAAVQRVLRAVQG